MIRIDADGIPTRNPAAPRPARFVNIDAIPDRHIRLDRLRNVVRQLGQQEETR
ncbi:MAG: hypothetical protein QM662_08560 [Gordonia sp. (in: high G+C Gram-positive bacteria)]